MTRLVDRHRQLGPGRRIVFVLTGLAVVAVVARLYALGYRVLYYDEAWVGYWVLKFLDHGVWEYRPIVHGPFFVRVNSVVFSLVGASDFTARLVVAVIGGLLPLSAWLFRDHLRDREVLALALCLAFNPLLLYYSRFMRNDLPLAAFMLLALGLLVRAYDTHGYGRVDERVQSHRPRYLYAAGISLGIAFATKESVLLWVVTWLGAGLLVLDRRLLAAHDRGDDVGTVIRSLINRTGPSLRTWGSHLVGAGLLFLCCVVYFYAPRPALWVALGGEFGMLPAVVEEATLGSVEKLIAVWVMGGRQGHPYLPYLGDTIKTLIAGAPAISILALVGFVYDRYFADQSRDVVAFTFYCGVAALLGYPLANFLPVPWSVVHAVVPLSIPAAVGAGVIYRWGQDGISHERTALSTPGFTLSTTTGVSWPPIRAGIAFVVLLVLLSTASVTAIETSYLHPHESPAGSDGGHEIVYFAQPPAELRSGLTAIDRAAATGGNDIDVLYVGESLAMNESRVEQPPGTAAWFERVPLPWYTERADADVASVDSATDIDTLPPVVITTPALRNVVARRLGGEYTATRSLLDDRGVRRLVVFVRET